jgi:hypothetical protein
MLEGVGFICCGFRAAWKRGQIYFPHRAASERGQIYFRPLACRRLASHDVENKSVPLYSQNKSVPFSAQLAANAAAMYVT